MAISFNERYWLEFSDMARKGQSFKLAPPSPKSEVGYRIWRALRSQKGTASKQRTLVDPLERFRATPNRAFFLYDGFSAEIGEWVERYLPELNDRSGEYLDIYDYTITNYKAEGVHAASRNIASRLSPIPNSSWDEIYSAGLPSILIWSDKSFRDPAYWTASKQPSQDAEIF